MAEEQVRTGVDAAAAIAMPTVRALFGLGLEELTAVMAALGREGVSGAAGFRCAV